MNTRAQSHPHSPARAYLIASALAVILSTGLISESEARGGRWRAAVSSAPVVKKATHRAASVRERIAEREIFNHGPIISVGKSLLEEHRAGFSDFGGGDCLPGSRCQQFSEELADFLDDLLALTAAVPGDAVDAVRIEKLRDRLDNGEVRPFVLYLMSKALPENGRWKSLASKIHEIVEDIDAIGDDEADVEHPGWRCGELRQGARLERLKLRKALLNRQKARIDMVKPTLKFIGHVSEVVPNIRGGVAAAVNATIGIVPGKIVKLVTADSLKTLVGNIDKVIALRVATLDVRIARIDLACADK